MASCASCGSTLVDHPSLALVVCLNPFCMEYDRYKLTRAARDVHPKGRNTLPPMPPAPDQGCVVRERPSAEQVD